MNATSLLQFWLRLIPSGLSLHSTFLCSAMRSRTPLTNPATLQNRCYYLEVTSKFIIVALGRRQYSTASSTHKWLMRSSGCSSLGKKKCPKKDQCGLLHDLDVQCF
ncbi:uncharacterized protein [Triticum aestivum]|uniref:uncharacterized protein isoform X2 n=1 Tax=Triticum aestivum TaxID=4565 RepID=UPI001D00D102|nr:uncharacterized protein LOC123191076 isoform X2 [Triticum aestivum]